MKKRVLERTKVISLRLKPGEHEFLLAEAAKMYVPLSAYIRHRLFGRESVSSERVGRKS
jgi:hypothetical protein